MQDEIDEELQREFAEWEAARNEDLLKIEQMLSDQIESPKPM